MFHGEFLMDKNGQKIDNKKLNNESKSKKLKEKETKETIDEETLNETDKKIKINLRIQELENKLIEIKKSERDKILRARAEAENIIKRTEKDIENAHKFALEGFISELLPVIDNLERTVEITKKEKKNFPSLIEGLELTLKSFLSILKKNGVEKIKIKKNCEFNPEFHQAVKIVKNDKLRDNEILKVIQEGYTLNSRLLRPAMVVVSKI
ncbi:hypothetical protein AOQ88_01095 [Candidatus Riesia sp. GBBU]|nr:hypothetical protein AOQ88_01095 [Candidatus Riesia sp. GBBU]